MQTRHKLLLQPGSGNARPPFRPKAFCLEPMNETISTRLTRLVGGFRSFCSRVRKGAEGFDETPTPVPPEVVMRSYGGSMALASLKPRQAGAEL